MDQESNHTECRRAALDATAEFSMLCREFPAWAVWGPHQRRRWIAVRAASSRTTGPDLPLVWTEGADAAELADRMRRVDEQLGG